MKILQSIKNYVKIRTLYIYLTSFMKKRTSAFTLVELIVVITILSILWTITFLSFQWYNKDARDSVRISDMKNIQTWLGVFAMKNWVYPDTENPVTITTSWIIIWYQGYFWNTTSRIMEINKTPVDPLDNWKYIYSLNAKKTQYQLMSFTEWNPQSSIINQTYATDYTKRIPMALWDNLWIILDTSNNPITWSWVEVSTWSTNYKVVFSNSDIITSSWNTLFSSIYNKRDDLLKDKNLASIDNSLVWYWDMETLTWWLLKDLSKYGNNWICYDWSTSVNCWTSWSWPQIVSWNWKTWNAMSFDWKNVVVINNNSNRKTLWNRTRSILVKSQIQSSWDSGTHDFWTERTTTDKFLLRISPDWKYNFHYYRTNLTFPNFNISRVKNQFDFITTTKNWANINFYINWEKVASLTNSDNLPDDNNQIFLWSTNDVRYQTYIWLMDEVRIYNRAFSDSEIQTLYKTIK